MTIEVTDVTMAELKKDQEIYGDLAPGEMDDDVGEPSSNDITNLLIKAQEGEPV